MGEEHLLLHMASLLRGELDAMGPLFTWSERGVDQEVSGIDTRRLSALVIASGSSMLPDESVAPSDLMTLSPGRGFF